MRRVARDSRRTAGNSGTRAKRERTLLGQSILRGLRAEARGDTISHEQAMREIDTLLQG